MPFKVEMKNQYLGRVVVCVCGGEMASEEPSVGPPRHLGHPEGIRNNKEKNCFASHEPISVASRMFSGCSSCYVRMQAVVYSKAGAPFSFY